MNVGGRENGPDSEASLPKGIGTPLAPPFVEGWPGPRPELGGLPAGPVAKPLFAANWWGALHPAPRMTQRSKWFHKDYFAWAESVGWWARRLYWDPPSRGSLIFRLQLLGPIRGDLSNHLKAWEDILQGIVYKNDRQIVQVDLCSIPRSESRGAWVEIVEIESPSGLRPERPRRRVRSRLAPGEGREPSGPRARES